LGFRLLLGLIFVLTPLLEAQEVEPPEATSEVDEQNEQNAVDDEVLPGLSIRENMISGTENDEGIFLNAQSVEIQILLQQLSQSQQVNIVATGDVQGKVSINLYGVELKQALEAILSPHGFAFVERDNFIYVMKAETISAFNRQPQQMEVVIYTLNYLSIDDAKEILKLYLSSGGEIMAGKVSEAGIGGTGSSTGGESNAANNMVVIKDLPRSHQMIAKALAELDRRPRQVLVEATILEVTLDDNHRLGVDFNALGGVDYGDLDDTASNLRSITPGGAKGPLIDSGFTSFGTRGFTQSDNAEGFSFGILKADLSVFFDALESVTDTDVLANPKILALNRQSAEIIIGGRLGYYGSETLSEGGFSQQEVEFLDVGTQLRFRPFIAEDGFIRLEIHPERSDGVVDSVTGLPSETTSEVTTNILIKDGDTVVIGGLIEERDTITIAQVPLLGTLPGIGWLFRKEETGTKRIEIVMLITPHIVDPGATDESAEDIITGHVKRKRSFRHGFKVYTRTLRAELHIEESRLALESGRLSLAAFHLEWARSLDPQSSEIVEIDEQIQRRKQRDAPRRCSLEDYIWREIQ